MIYVTQACFAEELVHALDLGAALMSVMPLIDPTVIEQWWPEQERNAPGVRHFVYEPTYPVDYHLFIDPDGERALLDVRPRFPLEISCPTAV